MPFTAAGNHMYQTTASTGWTAVQDTPNNTAMRVVAQDVRLEQDGTMTVNVTYQAVPAETNVAHAYQIVSLPAMRLQIPNEQLHTYGTGGMQNPWHTAGSNYYTQEFHAAWHASQYAQYNRQQYNYNGGPPVVPCTCNDDGMCMPCQKKSDLARAAAELAEKQRIEREKKERQKARALKRGRKLLLRCLTEAQQREYAREKRFTVEAADGRVFRLRKGKTAELLGSDGNVDATFCIHLTGGYIAEDTLVAQKLLLETDPAAFEKIANITKIRTTVPAFYNPITNPIAPQLTREQHERYLREYYRDARAMLRAEGIENPDEWMDGVRRQVQDHHRVLNGGQYQPAQMENGTHVAAQAIVEDELHALDSRADDRHAVAA